MATANQFYIHHKIQQNFRHHKEETKSLMREMSSAWACSCLILTNWHKISTLWHERRSRWTWIFLRLMTINLVLCLMYHVFIIMDAVSFNKICYSIYVTNMTLKLNGNFLMTKVGRKKKYSIDVDESSTAAAALKKLFEVLLICTNGIN